MIGIGNEPVVERDFVGVHAAVTDGVDCSTFHFSATRCATINASVLHERETVAFATGLRHHKHCECFVGERLVGVGPGQEHERIGARTKGAPGLDAIDEPTAFGRSGGGLNASNVGAVIGFSDSNCSHDLGRCQLRKPFASLFLGATGEKSASKNFWTGNKRATSAKRDLGQFFGGYDHSHVFTFAAFAVTVVLDWNREAETTQFGQTLNEVFRDI